MYYSTDSLTGFRATATDGELGKVLGFAFDDRTWKVPRLIVRASWLPSHVVMADAYAVKLVDGAKRRIFFDLTKDELRRQPDIHQLPPVHKLGAEATSLRDTSEVIGYRIEATDGTVGQLGDVVVDTRKWRVHELVVREGWLLRSSRAAAPEWVAAIDSAAKQVKLRVDREAVLSARAFNPEAPVNTTHETRVVDYTGKTHLAKREEVVS